MTYTHPTKEQVFESLDNALDNTGPAILGWEDADWAEDMMHFDYHCEDSSVEYLAPLIREWRKERGHPYENP